jgi:hypothetical protein
MIDPVRLMEFAVQLNQELRRNSRRIIGSLVEMAKQDDRLTPWAAMSGIQIVRISKQPISTYPTLVPLVERLFETPPSKGFPDHRIDAARMLGENGLKIKDVFDFAQQLIKDPAQGQFPIGVNVFIALAPYSPEAVKLLDETLRTDWNALSSLLDGLTEHKARILPGFGRGNAPQLSPKEQATKSKLIIRCKSLIEAVATIGIPARESLTLLHEIAESENSSVRTPADQQASFGGNFGGNGYPTFDGIPLKDVVTKAIKQIEEAKPKSPPEPLPEDDSFSVSTQDSVKPANDAKNLRPEAIERTYDGIGYSQWMKLLETERKPDKLITAIEACTRLIEKGDERRVARGIFLAEAAFDSEKPSKEKQLTKTAGIAGLTRLPGDIVVDELLATLRNSNPPQTGGEFQFQVVWSTCDRDDVPLTKIVRGRAEEVLAEFVRLIPSTPTEDVVELAQVASDFWIQSKRPMSDFDGLENRLLSMFSVIVSDDHADKFSSWKNIVENVISAAPDTPNLAVMLINNAVNHDQRRFQIVELVGQLGTRGEPAVPRLVEMFLAESKKLQEQSLQLADDIRAETIRQQTGGQRQVSDFTKTFFRDHKLRFQIIKTLGDIGAGPLGADLIRQLKAIEPVIDLPANNVGDQYSRAIFDAVNQAFPKIAHIPISEPDSVKLGDFWKLNGRWLLNGSSPDSSRTPERRFTAVVCGGTIDLGTKQADGSFHGGFQPSSLVPINILFEFLERPSEFLERPMQRGRMDFSIVIDETKPTKQLTLVSGDWYRRKPVPLRIEGIYQLTDTTLKLQLAKPGKPRPEDFSTDAAILPADHVQLVFDRELPEDANHMDAPTEPK